MPGLRVSVNVPDCLPLPVWVARPDRVDKSGRPLWLGWQEHWARDAGRECMRCVQAQAAQQRRSGGGARPLFMLEPLSSLALAVWRAFPRLVCVRRTWRPSGRVHQICQCGHSRKRFHCELERNAWWIIRWLQLHFEQGKRR
jgi:hypothetical protein